MRSLVTLVLIGALFLSGCLTTGTVEVEEEPPTCETYPDEDHMRETWSAQINNTKEGYNAVRFGMSSWGMNKNETEGEAPELFVNWTKYPEPDRPRILSDVVCFTLGKIQEGWTPPLIGSTPAPHPIAEDAMVRLEKELFLQTGAEVERCCYLWVDGMYYGVGWNGSHKTWLDGSSSDCC